MVAVETKCMPEGDSLYDSSTSLTAIVLWVPFLKIHASQQVNASM